MQESIRVMLMEYAEEGYRDFSASLVPGAKPLLGVRLPQLRKLAKELVMNNAEIFNWRAETSSYEGEYADLYFEETMLRGMVIGYGTAQGDVSCEEGLAFLEMFLPHIDNWSVCDSFCSSFTFANQYRDAVWEFLQPYLYSKQEYEVRTALVLLLNQYLKYDKNNKKASRKKIVTLADITASADVTASADITENHQNKECPAGNFGKFPYLGKILAALNRAFTQGYYARMAAAWILAEAFTYFPYETNQLFITDCKIDNWTYNKALQKIRESKNPNQEVKEYIKSLKK